MNVGKLRAEDPAYPAALRTYWGERAPERIYLLGNADLLRKDLLALFCSIRCPGNIILKTYDLARALRDAGVPVIGGFHTPMERECLTILLRGAQPIVICPARGLERIRLSAGLKDGIEAGRVLFVSMFGPRHRRPTVDLARQRSRLVAALAKVVFVSHAAPGGKTETLCREIIAMGKALFTVDGQENANLFSLGARAVAVEDLPVLRARGAW